MPPLLEQLLHDLLQRFRFLHRELDNLKSLPVDVIVYRDRIKTQIDKASRITEGLLADPDLAQPDFARNIFHHYKRLAELAQAVDEGPVFVLSRFQESDIFLTRLVTEMCREMGFQLLAVPDRPARVRFTPRERRVPRGVYAQKAGHVMKHKIRFVRSGRGKAQCAPDPDYPNGIAVVMPGIETAPHCLVELPYPAPECGHYLVECETCSVTLAITAAGRPDDPISVTMPCQPAADA